MRTICAFKDLAKKKLRNFMHIVIVKLAKWTRSKYKYLRSIEVKAIRWPHDISCVNAGSILNCYLADKVK